MRSTKALSVLMFISCSLLASSAPASDLALPDETSRLADRIDALVTPYVQLGMFNGVILVAQREQVRFLKPYGKASYDLDVALTTRTRFRIASLSKQFTNAALGTLMDQGKLNPATKVSEYLPDFPRADVITVEHLVNHASGVPHTNDLSELEGVTHISLDAMVDLLASKRLDFEPGTDERYSNGGYDLLAALIERASGTSYETYLQHAVLDPLDLDRSGRLHTYQVVPDLAQGYLPGPRPGSHSHARFYPAELRIGGGSMYSTAEEVFILFRATFQRQFAADTAPDLLFWDRSGRYEITGRSPGFVAKVFIDIPNDITIVSLANNYSFLVQWGRRLYQAVIGEPWETLDLHPVRRLIALDQTAYYAGTFASPWDQGTISVNREGHLEYFDADNDWSVALIPLPGDRWVHPFFDLICSFEGERRAETILCRPALERLNEVTRFERVQ